MQRRGGEGRGEESDQVNTLLAPQHKFWKEKRGEEELKSSIQIE
jgi:hypothetical protein